MEFRLWGLPIRLEYGVDSVVIKDRKFGKPLCLLQVRPLDIIWSLQRGCLWRQETFYTTSFVASSLACKVYQEAAQADEPQIGVRTLWPFKKPFWNFDTVDFMLCKSGAKEPIYPSDQVAVILRLLGNPQWKKLSSNRRSAWTNLFDYGGSGKHLVSATLEALEQYTRQLSCILATPRSWSVTILST